ncbi:CDP-glycerol glycerophosphotransferase family protein [Olegusella massiliensis]|uniref:CDP-glycerol glycerophosphotransferase family protein n=1 Tax=Olegusella massiliensis TaxID=1776381 RepID=UPI004055663C
MSAEEKLHLACLRWVRTSCYLELAADTPYYPSDEFWLASTSGTSAAFRLTETYIESDHCLRFRPLLGQNNKPICPGSYEFLVVREGKQLRITVPQSIQFVPAQIGQSSEVSSLAYIQVASSYFVIPNCVEGKLTLTIEARGFPTDFKFHPRKRLKAAKKALKRAREDRLVIAFYNFCRKHCRYRENKILFTSDNREELGGNLSALYMRMDERGLFTQYQSVFSFQPQRGGRSLSNRLSLAYHLATSKFIFCDDHQPFLYHINYDKRTQLVQLWHACGTFKTIGHGRIGTLEVQSPFSLNHSSYTAVAVAAEQDIPVYAEAFGIPDERVHAWGIPRHDELLDVEWQQQKRAEFAKKFPAAAGKKVVVFAPTFRGTGKGRAYYDFSQLDICAIARCCRKNNLFFIFKMHPLVTTSLSIPQDCVDVCVDGSTIREVNDLLPSADVLISDYSSVVYEAALLNIPTLYFAYDLESYMASRSLYQPFKDFVSGKIVTSCSELLQALANEDYDQERLKSFRQKNFAHLKGGVCDRIIDAVIKPTLL